MALAQYEVRPRDGSGSPLRAVHLDPGNLSAAAGWCGGTVESESTRPGRWTTLLVLADGTEARTGDWIVRDTTVQGLPDFVAFDNDTFMARWMPT